MIRGIGVRGATAVNVITMIGIGPLITIPLVLSLLHGSLALAAWIVGAIIALCDGLVWAELGSLYPTSGGTYAYLREAFGTERWGRLAAFLFTWQTVLSAPLLLASGYIGFAGYAAYLFPGLATNAPLQGFVGAAVGVATLVLLYRSIGTVGAIGVGFAGIAIATLLAVIAAGAAHFNAQQAAAVPPGPFVFWAVALGIGPALVITLYDYLGYGAANALGDEVREPARVLPRAVLFSIAIVATLYIALQVGVLGSVPWQKIVPDAAGNLPPAAQYVAATVVERVWGSWPARIVTLAILVTAFASTFGNLLAFSRIPYAAARDGLFFAPFARLAPNGKFPNVALVTIGLLALPACFLPLGTVIAALTAGLVVVQGLLQIVAVGSLRARGVRAPYRMWLYPLPALIAFAGWVFIFISSGKPAIEFGLGTLALGVVAFLWLARVRAQWPFPAKAALVALAFATIVPGVSARAAEPLPSWGHARTVESDGWPVFEVDGRPFFVYGASFFYERLPRDRWASSMRELQDLGINTLDLYVPWNWHELADGDFDFKGRTNPRRDLDEVLRLARADGFKILLRPGPVIRNEWRNGGYPAWLLERPEYGMPLHDLLEGRYPPTATLQNAHSDDAAAQWMANATHVKYAKRWLQTVLHECAPYADLILAVALDDDQGAYIDNQTYPAPHFQAYLGWLRDVVHGVTGTNEPVFINTYQMKVTASAPVWAMGNWYQSDAYAIGEHDRAQLEFSTGLLHTRPHQVMMASEFQAGWLEQADDIRPRPADPSNTSLAFATMLGQGVRGVVNFPAQDSIYPAGWEVPFANSFYAWDAALGFDGDTWPRSAPVAALGALVRTFGPELAASRPMYDAAVLYLGGSLRSENATNPAFAAIADATIDAQQQCRDAALSCAVVDPSAVDDSALRNYGMLLVPKLADTRVLDQRLARRLARLRASGAAVISADAGETALVRALASHGHRPVVSGIAGATFARSASSRVSGFLTIPNYSSRPMDVVHAVIDDGTERITLPAFHVEPHSALFSPINVQLSQFGTAEGRLIFSDCTVLDYNFHTGSFGNFMVPSFRQLGLAHYATLPTSHPPRCAATVVESDATYRYELDGETNVVGRHGEVPAIDMLVPNGYYHREPVMPLRTDVDLQAHVGRAALVGHALAYREDWYRDGAPLAILDNGMVRVGVSPQAGARAFFFQDDLDGRNCFTTVGALRDDVAVEPPLSTVDRIAKYTHDFPAGTFNRPYDVTLDAAPPPSGSPAVATFAYDAPDVVPSGARFERRLSLASGERAFTMDERVAFHGPGDAGAQRAVSVTSLSVGAATTMDSERVFAPSSTAFAALTTLHVTSGHALGYFDSATHEFATIAWRAGDVEDATILERRYSLVVRLTLANGHVAHTRYGYERADNEIEAARLLAAADDAAQVAPPEARTR